MESECKHRWTRRVIMGPPQQVCNACGAVRPYPNHLPGRLKDINRTLSERRLWVCSLCGCEPEHEIHRVGGAS